MNRELSDEAQSLISRALRDEITPGAEHRKRLRRAVLARAAAGGTALVVGSGVAKASAGKSLLVIVATGMGLGVGAGVAVSVAASAAFSEAPRSDSERPREERAAPRPATTLNAQRPKPSTIELPSAAPEPSSPLAASAPTGLKLSDLKRSVASDSPLRAELDLLALVQAALRDGQSSQALALIARYDASFPRGALENERLAAEVFAACQAGDRVRAARAADHFLLRDETSALAARVRRACPASAVDVSSRRGR